VKTALNRVLLRSTGPWLWVLTPLFLAALPHFLRTPFWLGLACMGLWLLRLAAVDRPRLVPTRPLRLLLAAACISGVYASYGYLLGPEPGTALLLLLLALKPLETKGYRDQLVIVLLTYLLILLHFLASQSLLAAGYMALVIFLNTATMFGLVHGQSQGNPGFRLRQAAILLIQALPVMLLLFVLFPRFPGSLWGLFQKPQTALTGLSETMNPGDVSRLTQSPEMAFRVAFEGQSPPASLMYWRVLVLWETDGRTWRVGKSDPGHGLWNITASQEPIRYVLTLEPHGQNWLPALEMPLEIPDNAEPATDMRLRLKAPMQQRTRFSMASALGYNVDGLLAKQRRRALALPETGNALSRSKAETWRSQLSGDQAIFNAALDMFRDGSFAYSLTPPLLGPNAVDDFLFKTRDGYCEHYASAFTFLMRAAGIPARVVLGYQGGERNPLGEYYMIRQYHAHAWSEVWLSGQGWVRVDLTSILAPERIQIGAGALVPDIGVPGVLSDREIAWAITLWRNLTLGWDAANALWNQWVLDFGSERQKRFFQRLGLSGASRLERFGYLLLGLAGSCLAAGLIYGVLLLRARPRPDALDTLYARFCKRLARVGIVRRANEGPLDFALRASALRADLADTIMAVSQVYMRQKYGAKPETGSIKKLGRLVQRFRP